jgi:predicted secreted protein
MVAGFASFRDDSALERGGMNLYAIFAIYVLFWTVSAFVVLPFGIRTPDETGEALMKGQADSAPSNFRPLRVIMRTTILATILFGLYYANYVEGWITAESLDRFARAPR